MTTNYEKIKNMPSIEQMAVTLSKFSKPQYIPGARELHIQQVIEWLQ